MNKKLVSIRGAVTTENTVEAITKASRRLVDKIYFKNDLSDSDVVNITFSTTQDLTAFYPARAVREAGRRAPLFSCVEPNIDGSLKNCIRVMVTCYSDKPAYNVYLKGARVLRPDLVGAYSIALDGPSGAGKSTVAKLVASELNAAYLDTGALYRALGLTVLNNGVKTDDAKGVESCLKDVTVTVEYLDGAQHVLVNGIDVSDKIRTPQVSMAASAVSAIPYVREKLLGIQRKTAAKQSVILDGRDIGTVVLPNAEFKYYLTASAEIRAKRRYDELIAKGEKVSFQNVLADVIERDKNDSTRKIAPLKKAYDAVEINSDGMTAADVAGLIINEIKGDL